MISLHLKATRPELLAQLTRQYLSWPALHAKVRQRVAPNKKEVWEEQALAIAILAAQYNRPGCRILELGANRGYTACVMALAAPLAHVTTLEPNAVHRRIARTNVAPIATVGPRAHLGALNVSVRPESSVAFLGVDSGTYDMIFVDGDHKNIRLDLPWFNRLNPDGLFLHHDYAGPESSRPCPPVYDALNYFAGLRKLPCGVKAAMHDFDVLVSDETGTAIAGFYRHEGEVWNDEGAEAVIAAKLAAPGMKE